MSHLERLARPEPPHYLTYADFDGKGNALKPFDHQKDLNAVEQSRSVMVTTAYPYSTGNITAFRQLAAKDRVGRHRLTGDPDLADVILFIDDYHLDVDPLHKRIRNHPLVQSYPEKTFVYNFDDRPFCFLPGVYCSMPRRYFRADRQRACPYILNFNPSIEEASSTSDMPDLLFSFVGRANCRTRSKLLSVKHPDAYLDDTTGRYEPFAPGQEREAKIVWQKRYADVTARSKFVLCPRGVGTSSFRLFETLEAGRVPVILSDDWVPPTGPAWNTFSLRIPEARALDVPEILERYETHWQEMANEARRAWTDWFAWDVRFHRMVESCGQILESRRIPERIAQRLPTVLEMPRRVYMPVRPIAIRLRDRTKA